MTSIIQHFSNPTPDLSTKNSWKKPVGYQDKFFIDVNNRLVQSPKKKGGHSLLILSARIFSLSITIYLQGK